MLASKPSRGNFVAMPIFIADLECGVRFLKSKTLADTKNTLSLSAFTQTNAEAGMVLLGGFYCTFTFAGNRNERLCRRSCLCQCLVLRKRRSNVMSEAFELFNGIPCVLAYYAN